MENVSKHVECCSPTIKEIISLLPPCLKATKLGKVVTYHEGLPSIKSHNPFITKSCEVVLQTKSISTTTMHIAIKVT